MRLVLEGDDYIDEGLLAAVVYELSKRPDVSRASRYREHPLRDRIVLEFEGPKEALVEAIEAVKRKLLEISRDVCERSFLNNRGS